MRIVPVLMLAALAAGSAPQAPVRVAPEKMPRIATVSERYQSYNIEMAELTGGQFWKPYEAIVASAGSQAAGSAAAQGPAFYANLKEALPPIDLSNARLRKLAAALGPAYVRSSGNVADGTYFLDSDAPAPAKPPKGFEAVLTRKEWKGLIDFAHATNAQIVTSFAVTGGTRDANARWTTDMAGRLIAYTRSAGGEIAAAEFFNEPTLGPQGIGGLPADYDAEDFARDYAVFQPFARSVAPDMLILGPSATGEGPITLLAGKLIKTSDLFSASPHPNFDAFSYHAYGASSLRCKSPGKLTTTADAALTEEWLSRTERTYQFYAGLRDRYEPGKPIWITEAGEASCGGDPWAKTFLDTFRYLDQLGRLARHGVQTIMHNTLAVSDYGLLDRATMMPRPNYWAALLWRRLMGTTVLDSGIPVREGLHLYAQCTPGRQGSVTVLAINNDASKPTAIDLSKPAERYTLTARKIEDTRVQLNGADLALGANDALPELKGTPVAAGNLSLAPASITFLVVPAAGNGSCG
jgi:heparanase